MPLPLILGAFAAGRAIYGAIDANQKSQRNKGYIGESYAAAKARLDRQQQLGRQGTTEELSARGLGGISPIQGAMLPGASPADPHTLGEQLGADNEKQYALEQKDLTQQRDRALQDNSDARTSSYINSAFAGANIGMQAYGASQELNAMKGGGVADGSGSIADASTPASAMSPIQRAMLPSTSSVDHPDNWFGGIVGHTDPLRAPGSSWNMDRGTRVAGGESNAEFHV